MKDVLFSCDLVLIFERFHYNIEVYQHIEKGFDLAIGNIMSITFTIFNKKASIHYT
jgi:hypothetical protein